MPDGSTFEIDVDISINKPLEMLNSHLIYMYCTMDERFRKVAMVLKSWNKRLSNEKEKRLNSFSVYMLLLAFMLSEKYMIDLQLEAPKTQPLQVKVYLDKETQVEVTT